MKTLSVIYQSRYVRDFLLKMLDVLIIPVAIESLLYLTLCQTKGKYLHPLKH